jgi:uncharacterized protein
MGTTVTIRIRTLVLTLAIAVVVLAAYAVGSAQAGTSGADAAEDVTSSPPPSIAMTGTGDVTGVPDQLTFSLAISATASDVSTALQSASNTTRSVLSAVKQQDVATKDVRTTGLSIAPVYDYSGDGPGVITGYAVTESMSVLVRSLPSAGTTITAAVQAGGNAVRLHDVHLQIADEDALLHSARADAIAQAKAKAEQYAAAAGRQLGDVMTIREVSASPVYQPSLYRSSADAAPVESVPIRAGTAKLHVTVKVVWSFA